jgi:hypothetical protein
MRSALASCEQCQAVVFTHTSTSLSSQDLSKRVSGRLETCSPTNSTAPQEPTSTQNVSTTAVGAALSLH